MLVLATPGGDTVYLSLVFVEVRSVANTVYCIQGYKCSADTTVLVANTAAKVSQHWLLCIQNIRYVAGLQLTWSGV